MRQFARLMIRGMVIGAALCASGASVSPACARQGVLIEADDATEISYAKGQERPPALEPGELMTLLARVGITEEQKPLIVDLQQGYLDSLQKARRQMGEWYRKTFLPDGQWRNDPELWKKSQPVIEKYVKHCLKLRTSLMEDAKLMLSPEQQDGWPKVEARLKRRDLMRGSYSQVGLATIDLEEITRKAMDGAALPDDAAELFTGYQEAVDRASSAAEKYDPEQSKYKLPEEGFGQTEESRRKWRAVNYARDVEKWRPLRDLNISTLKRALPLLPEEVQVRVRLDFYSRGDRYAGWYSDQRMDLNFGKILALDGLTEDQKKEINKIRSDYEREAADRAQRKAEAVVKSQDDDPEAAVAAADDPGAWTREWSEQTAQQEKPRARLRDVLTADQLEKAGLGKKRGKMEVPTFKE